MLQDRITGTKVFNEAFSAFVLFDPVSDEVLFDHHGDKHFTPASNTKIATLLTCLELLGDSMPILAFAEYDEQVFFEGSGNPLNLNPYIEDNQQIIDWLMVHEDKRLCYVPADPAPNKYASGWAWDDYLYYYQLENSALPVYGNQISILKKGDVFSVLPDAFEAAIQFQKDSLNQVSRPVEQNDYTILSSRDSFERVIPFHWTDSLAVELLAIETGLHIGICPEKETGDSWTKVYIPFPDSLFVLLMQESDNFIAEQLLLMTAYHLSDTLDQRIGIREATKRWEGFLRDTMRWVDGSGLSRYNLFTPYTNVQLLDRLIDIKSTEWIFSIFPTGGASGTISSWYHPYVHAKTGSLSNNHNLSGYIETSSGKILIFSFMHNHFMGDNVRFKREMESVLGWIHENY